MKRREQAGSHAQTILVPVDFSAGSAEAVRFAARLADLGGIGLLLLHVIPRDPPDREAACHELEAFLTGLRAEAERSAALDRARTRVVVGIPAECIREVAEQERVLMIVIGGQGRGGLARWSLGSVADEISHASRCPVTIVRGDPDDRRRRPRSRSSARPQHRPGPAENREPLT